MDEKKVHGYAVSKHIFGRNILVRDRRVLYYLKWQWKITSTVNDIIYLSAEQYQAIKKMLLMIKTTKIIVHTNGVETAQYYHNSASKNYAKIKRYLIKNKLLKEE